MVSKDLSIHFTANPKSSTMSPSKTPSSGTTASRWWTPRSTAWKAERASGCTCRETSWRRGRSWSQLLSSSRLSAWCRSCLVSAAATSGHSRPKRSRRRRLPRLLKLRTRSLLVRPPDQPASVKSFSSLSTSRVKNWYRRSAY